MTDIPEYTAPEGRKLARYGDVPVGTDYFLTDTPNARRRKEEGSHVWYPWTLVLVEDPPPFDFRAWVITSAYLAESNPDEDETGWRWVARWDEIHKVAGHVEIRDPCTAHGPQGGWFRPSRRSSTAKNYAADALFEVRAIA